MIFQKTFFRKETWTLTGIHFLLLCFIPLLTQAQTDPLPSIDVRVDNQIQVSKRTNVQETQVQAFQNLNARFPDLKIEWSPFTGTAKNVRSLNRFLTTPSAEAPELIALNYVRANFDIFGLSEEDISSLTLVRTINSKKSGITRLFFQQDHRGINLSGGELRVNLTKDGEIINCGSDLIPSLSNSVNIKKAKIKVMDAIARAANNIGMDPDIGNLSAKSSPLRTNSKAIYEKGANFSEDVYVELKYWPLNKNNVRLVWEIALGSANDDYFYQVLVDAENGNIMSRVPLNENHHVAGPKWRVFDSDNPAPLTPGPATPDGTQGTDVSRVLIETNGDAVASPSGWIPAAGTTTMGNNADAFLDKDDNGVPDVARPSSATQEFDFPLDLSLGPDDLNNVHSATVNAFYWANWFHDRLYHLGFDEEAGNFQVDNFGRGGVAGDPVEIRLQSGQNNSTFLTLADGNRGIWRVFVFTGSNPDRDAAFDQEIGIHELTHGLTNRMVGGPNNRLTGLQPRGMGEGWSDFYAITLLSKPGDDINGNYGIGGWSLFNWFIETPGWDDNYYYGIRRYPYTTDMTKSPLTFADIDPAQFAADPAIPTAPWLDGGFAATVHRLGEIWCSALWECRANLINFYGYTDGNELILELVTDGLALIPNNTPTMIEARDAILQADMVKTGGANQCLLWKGFSKRGLGPDATSPASFTTNGVVESFYDEIQVVAAMTPPTCPGACDASIDLTVSGGYGTVTFQWGGGQISEDLTGLCAGTYNVIIGDDLGCTVGKTIIIPDGIDNEAPMITCPADIEVSCDINPTETGEPVVTDNCDPSPIITSTDVELGGDCEWFCEIERTWTATDASGNSSSCKQVITKNTLPLIQDALSKDLDGNGQPDGLVLGFPQTTLTITPDKAQCVLDWLPGTGSTPSALKRGNQTVNGCLPGTNPVDSKGKITNPLFADALKLELILRLYPNFGETKLSDLPCTIAPIVLQTLRNGATVNDFIDVVNKALANLVLVPHLQELQEAVDCITDPLDICKDPTTSS